MSDAWNHPVVALVLRVAAAGSSFAFGIVSARVLGVEDFGLVSVLIGFVNLGVTVALLGHETLATRVMAVATSETLAAHEAVDAATYRKKAARHVWVAGFIVFSAGFVAVGWFGLGARADFEFLLLLGLIPIIARTLLSQAIVRGAHRAGLAIVPDGIVRPLLAVLLLGVAWMTAGIAPGPFTAILACACAVSLVIGMTWENRVFASLRTRASRRNGEKPFDYFVPAIYASSVLAAFVSQLAVIAVGMLENSSQAGVYAAAERFSLAAALIGQAVYLAVASRLAAFHASGAREPLCRLVRQVTRRVAMATLLLCLGVGVAAHPLLSLYGDEFTRGEPVLYILLISTIVNASAGPTGQVLLMTNHQREHLIAMAISCAVQMVLLLVLVPRGGVYGAAWAVLISTITWNGVMMYYVRRRLALNPVLAWA